MRYRRPQKRSARRRDGSPFFVPFERTRTAPETAFFPRASQEQPGLQRAEGATDSLSQAIDDRELARQAERNERVSQEAEDEQEEVTAQDGREEELATQRSEERDEMASQASEREDDMTTAQDERDEQVATQGTEDRDEATAMGQADEQRRDEPMPAQAPATAGALRQGLRSGGVCGQSPAGVVRQGLAAPRFAGDRRLAAAAANRRYVRRGDRGDAVVRLQQALVELGFQLPGVGIDGIFGSETERAVRAFQKANGLSDDGIVGRDTMGELDRQLNLPIFDWSGSLRERLRQMIAQGRTYAQMRAVIRAASLVERIFALIDRGFLRAVRDALAWDDFARIVELLGLQAPDGNALIADAAVQAAVADAWTDSRPAVTSWSIDNAADPRHSNCSPSVSPHPRAARTGTHEEGGWIYLNLITGGIYTRRAPAGTQAGLALNNPPQILDSILVGVFHTHPNLGACWSAQPSSDDANFGSHVDLPVLARGQVGGASQDFVTPAPAPARRAHLAGPRGYPMAGGAIAPQSPAVAPTTSAKRRAVPSGVLS